MEDKKSFVLYTEYEEPISDLSDEEAGKLFKEIFAYVRSGTENNLEGVAKMAFKFIKKDIDINNQKYAETLEKRREAGKKGGRPKKETEQAKANGFSEKQKVFDENQKKQTKAKKADNDNVNVNVNDNDNVNVNENGNDYNIYSSEQNCSEPPVIKLPLNDKTEFEIFNRDVIKWEELYPNADIMQELRKMKGWLDANPQKKKTRSGISRFVNNWLSREQDKGSNIPTGVNTAQQSRGNPFLAMLSSEGGVTK